MSGKRWRSKWSLALYLAAAVTAALAITALAWDTAPTEDKCRAELMDHVQSGGGMSDACADWMNDIAAQFQETADVTRACKDAVEQKHNAIWTALLVFDSTDAVVDEDGQYRVTGAAHYKNSLGQQIDQTYECTLRVHDGKANVLTSRISR